MLLSFGGLSSWVDFELEFNLESGWEGEEDGSLRSGKMIIPGCAYRSTGHSRGHVFLFEILVPVVDHEDEEDAGLNLAGT